MADGPLTIHDGEILLSESARAILDEQYADAPPKQAHYRPADLEAVACWNCAHFERTGVGDDNWPIGICHIWEAKVQGEAVCDRFTVDTTMSEGAAHTAPQDDYAFSLSEVYLPGTELEFSGEDGMFLKTILRTGEWQKTPGPHGVAKKTLKIVRDGASDIQKGVVSLSELVKSFKDKAYEYVTVPLSDDENKDHKNLLSLNKGFVKDMWIEDGDDGVSRLRAKIHLTDAEAREKVKDGTFPDVSSGIFGGVENPSGDRFGSAINHVCLTRRPFISDLGPFAVLASDDDKQPETIDSFVPKTADGDEENPENEFDERLTFGWMKEKVDEALHSQLNLSDDYFVEDIAPERAIITNKVAEISWVAPFSFSDESVRLSIVEDWSMRNKKKEETDGDEQGSERPEEPEAAPASVALSEGSEVDQARTLRELRSRGLESTEGGVQMSGLTEQLDRIDFSDEEKAKDAFTKLLEERQSLLAKSREGEVDEKIEKIKGMGFSDAPGFLKYCRGVYLSDDGEPAMVLLSFDDEGKETGGKTPITATKLLDDVLDAIPTDDKGKVLLAQQHLTTGNDDPPPKDDEGDKKPVEERTREAAEAIGQEMPDAGDTREKE